MVLFHQLHKNHPHLFSGIFREETIFPLFPVHMYSYYVLEICTTRICFPEI